MVNTQLPRQKLAFLANMLRPPPALAVRPTTLMHMQGLRDRTIPPAGGESADHWLYVSMNATLETWRKVTRSTIQCAKRTIAITSCRVYNTATSIGCSPHKQDMSDKVRTGLPTQSTASHSAHWRAAQKHRLNTK